MPRRLACALSVTALAVAAVPAVAVATAPEPAVAPVSLAPAMPDAPAASATAQEPGAGKVTSFVARFTTKRPGTSTGVLLRTTGAAPEPPATVAPVVRQMVAFPAGTLLRVGALPQCVGDGRGAAAQGAAGGLPGGVAGRLGPRRGRAGRERPVTFDLAVYAVRGPSLLRRRARRRAAQAGLLRRRASGRRLVLTVPTTNGAIAPTLFEARIAA